jgi:hypothetical protein
LRVVIIVRRREEVARRRVKVRRLSDRERK